MRIRIYKIGKTELIEECNVKSMYEDTFYHRNMPMLSAKQCRKILNFISPNFKVDSKEFVIENITTGYIGVQQIFRSGTILNF